MLDESTARVVLDVLKKYVSYEPRLMALLVELEQQRDLRLLARAETADARSVQRFCVISPSVTAEGERRTWHNDEGGAVMHAIGIMKGHDGRARPMRLLIVKVMAVVEREISEPRVRPPNKGESW